MNTTSCDVSIIDCTSLLINKSFEHPWDQLRLLYSLLTVQWKKSSCYRFYEAILKMLPIKENRVNSTEFNFIRIGENFYTNEINVELNNTCNLKCPLCPVSSSMGRSRGYMSFELWGKLAHQLVELRIIDVDLFGFGEPVLHKQFSKFVEYGAALGLQLRTSTNGFGLTQKEKVKDIVNSGLATLIVCLDGSTPQSHEAYRIGSSYNNIIQGIRMLVKARNEAQSSLKIIIQTLITKKMKKNLIPFGIQQTYWGLMN